MDSGVWGRFLLKLSSSQRFLLRTNVRAVFVIVDDVTPNQATQMLFVEDDDVIYTIVWIRLYLLTRYISAIKS